MNYTSKVPAAAAEYFKIDQRPPREVHPTIADVYYPGEGWSRWQRLPMFRGLMISQSKVRRMRSLGITHVAIRYRDKVADFSTKELEVR